MNLRLFHIFDIWISNIKVLGIFPILSNNINSLMYWNMFKFLNLNVKNIMQVVNSFPKKNLDELSDIIMLMQDICKTILRGFLFQVCQKTASTFTIISSRVLCWITVTDTLVHVIHVWIQTGWGNRVFSRSGHVKQ